MSRVASNHSTPRLNNDTRHPPTSFLSRSSSNASSINSIGNGVGGGGGGGGGRGVIVRSAAPAPVQKETVHACPLCNGEYKDPRVLPCTHTYCLNCIRDKLINNNRVTCPKCHHQVHPFDETELNELPRNLILSQEWRLNARPISSIPPPKKPVAYHPPAPTSTQMSNQHDKRKTSATSTNSHNTTTNETHSQGIAALVSAFNKSSGGSGERGSRSSRTSSVSSTQPVVSNLVKIYSEATTPRHQQQQQLQKTDSVISMGKHDELTRIFEQASNHPQRQHTSSASSLKRPSEAREEAYEEMTWDTLVHGTPAAPPFPAQWQTATEHHHQPPQAPERPISAASSHQSISHASTDRHSAINNLRDIVASIHQQTHEKPSPSFPKGPILDPQLHSRPSTTSHSHYDPDEDDRHSTHKQQPIYATIQLPQHRSRQSSRADSVHSDVSSSPSRRSPFPSMKNAYQQRSNIPSPHQQQQQHQSDKMSYHTASSSRRSSDRFPPPPQNLETFDFGNNNIIKQRSLSPMSSQSSAYGDANDQPNAHQAKFMSTERFNPDTDIPLPFNTNNSSSTQSQVGSGASTPTNRPISRSVERDSHYIIPAPSSSINTTVTARVDHLLSDQKRLEHEIEEVLKHLKYDYDDVRKQIDRKESAIHNEVKNIAAHLGNDITEHYRRKQKIYADLAADTNTVGTELKRLKSSTNTNNNKQQLWANLEQIEMNIRNIRQAVDQHKEPHGVLTFAEGRRAIAADTIGQITYTQIEPHRRFNSPSRPVPPPPLPAPVISSYQSQQTSTNISPYKYIKIDHLSTLEPEAIAITENNKKILLGICNKLFILSDHGEIIKVIPLSPSIRGIGVSKKHQLHNIAYVSHDETVSMIDIDSGQTLDCVKETDSTGESGTFLPLGIDTDNIRGDVYVCDYRNSCVIKFDDKLEFITQWRIYNHSNQYDEARPKLISVYGQKLYLIVEHSCKPYYDQGIAYTFSLHICDANSGNIIKIVDANSLSTQRLRWPCSVQAINNEKCYILDTMTSGKYFNGQWQKHWSRVLEIGQDDNNIVTELFQLDSEAATMAMTRQLMIIAANGDILFVDLGFLKQQQQNGYDHTYQNLP